ncbi:YdeI/OmpD-associated family protein [Paenibacillus graminis]|uniref:YdeI/OmpD-associated family protein n=1 Tax=Paenibacillus graminis TaxID=189425 RepID=UPI002DBB6DE7|nr:YdeI/OmpD-associated family protein [Paenibacillus graminis]
MSGLGDHVTELTDSQYDLIFAYVLNMKSLQDLVNQVIDHNHLNKGGYLYAAYPKKGNKVYSTYIHRDSLFEGVGAGENGYIGSSSLKFARMVGLNDVFTVVGFKEEARKKKDTSSKPSQRVDDYTSMIPAVEKELQDSPEALALYQSLTPGYRKDWARYVYSAVQEETRAKRRAEMKKILGEGYKSVDMYRRDKP